MSIELKPLGDRVIVKPVEKEEVSKGGIILPDTVKEKPQEGEVLAVGPGKVNDDGSRTVMEIAVGDRVMFSKWGGNEVTLDNGDKVLILHESDIIAKL